ncbi:hypothetical protein LOD99_1322 [Oopsacas minuta]|uniref:40S ribosomal protein S4 n=1 Tax=Oopsacas minuta TaxID=111878 RepID=A0AAV7K5M7_9METZ|nr:hypothetical protein LOD99_1322 [Oopsacas minuta]
MTRGPKKHLKRLQAPRRWMLDKLSGNFAPKPSSGPHKTRECLPLVILLRNRLKYALTYTEAKKILKSRNIKVDGKVRTEVKYPTGLMDVISIPKTKQMFRLLYDVKGRYILHQIGDEESRYKLGRVKKVGTGPKGIHYVVTHDGRTFRYPNPDIKQSDTVKIDLKDYKITDHIKFDIGALVMVTGGRNLGRIGIITNRERHQGSFEIIHVKDFTQQTFATRMANVFVIGKEKNPWVSLPKGKGVRLTIIEERNRRLAEKAKATSISVSS